MRKGADASGVVDWLTDQIRITQLLLAFCSNLMNISNIFKSRMTFLSSGIRINLSFLVIGLLAVINNILHLSLILLLYCLLLLYFR